ncbi:MAG: hypothetical protein ACXADX_12170, partial [Candidatus Hodarchaeales archaeon]
GNRGSERNHPSLTYCRTPCEPAILAGVLPGDGDDWCTRVFCDTGSARPAVRKGHCAGTANRKTRVAPRCGVVRTRRKLRPSGQGSSRAKKSKSKKILPDL